MLFPRPAVSYSILGWSTSDITTGTAAVNIAHWFERETAGVATRYLPVTRAAILRNFTVLLQQSTLEAVTLTFDLDVATVSGGAIGAFSTLMTVTHSADTIAISRDSSSSALVTPDQCLRVSVSKSGTVTSGSLFPSCTVEAHAA